LDFSASCVDRITSVHILGTTELSFEIRGQNSFKGENVTLVFFIVTLR